MLMYGRNHLKIVIILQLKKEKPLPEYWLLCALYSEPLLSNTQSPVLVFCFSPFIPIPKKGNPKECSNYRTSALISHASKVMLKILQARRQQYVNRELPDVQAGFRKGRGIRDQIANIRWIIEKAREFQKKHLFLLC